MTSDMIHHPDHYTWKGAECKKVIAIMTQGISGAEAYYMGGSLLHGEHYQIFVPVPEERNTQNGGFGSTGKR